MNRRYIARLAASASLLLPVLAHAELFTFGGTSVDVEYWTGTGQNQAMLVVDFNPGSSYAFGYRWDQAATGFDMVRDVAAAGGLDFTYTDWGAFGLAVDTISYNGNSMGTGGYPADYVYYYLSNDGLNWSESPAGASSTGLESGNWNGWAQQSVGYPGPYSAPVTPVPEPASAGLLAAGAAVLGWTRWAKRVKRA